MGNLREPSEFRRKYMKELVAALKKSACLDQTRAKEVASIIVTLFEDKVFWGQAIDLGFLTIQPKRKKPVTIQSHLDHSRGTFLIGERVKWTVKFSDAWVRKRKPLWSR